MPLCCIIHFTLKEQQNTVNNFHINADMHNQLFLDHMRIVKYNEVSFRSSLQL